MTGDSRADLEALRRSGSGKVLVLAVLLVAALAAAAWFLFFKPQGLGAAERPDKVLIVRSEFTGYSAVLARGGFDAAEGGLAHWVEKAGVELDEVPEGTDVQIILTLADTYGYGYVVFEHPAEVDFTGVDVDSMPAFEDHVRFAVFSVGDFAFPHQVTVNPEPPKALRRPEIGLLQALFAQEALAEALPDNTSASVDAIQLRSKLEDALADLALVDTAGALAERVMGEAERALQDERAEPAPVRLTEALEAGSALALPGGRVFTETRAYDVVTDDGIQVELSPASAFTLWSSGAAGQDRTACTSVLKGSASSLDSPRFQFAERGGAMVVETLSEGARLWVGDAQAPCGLVAAGDLPRPGLEDVRLWLPHQSGKMAWVGTRDGEAAVDVAVTKPEGTEVLHFVLEGVGLRDVAWLDAGHLAATADDGMVHVLSLADPSTRLAFQPPKLGLDPMPYEVAGVSASTLALTVGADPRRVVTVDAGRSWASLFEQPPVVPTEPSEPEGEDAPEGPTLLVLDASGFSTTVLTRAGHASGLVASPDGTALAFALVDRTLDDPGKGDDSEIAWVPAKGGALRLLTRNAVRDRDPQFTADGGHVLFQTRVELERSRWRVSVPRAVAVR